MTQPFRVITWNCRHASSASKLWDYLLELAPDVALLQDFGVVPKPVLEAYTHLRNESLAQPGGAPRYLTGILVKGQGTGDIPLPAPNDWVARELEHFEEFFLAKQVVLASGISLRVMSVYSPAFAVDPTRLEGIDTTGIQLTRNRNVWGTELLWATLRSMSIPASDSFIVGGDLNASETFDYLWGKKPRGNREFLDRMEALGLHECLRLSKGGLTPTFRSPRGGSIVHQIDHLFVTDSLSKQLIGCDVGSTDRVFGSSPMLSDHLPVIADFAGVG